MKDRILLVDDHRTFLAGTKLILEQHGFQVTAAASGPEALERMQEGRYDLCVFDLKLPGMNGFELTERALALDPEAVIVILTGEDLSEHYDRLMHAGVTGILEKSLAEDEFVSSLRLARQGLTVLPLPLARQLRVQPPGGTGAAVTGPGRGEEPGSPQAPGEKELAVLRGIAQGHKNKDIAERLFMSQRNVEYMISRLFERLGAGSRQEAVLKAIERGWLKLDP